MKNSFVKSKYWANKFVNYQPLAVRSALPSILDVWTAAEKKKSGRCREVAVSGGSSALLKRPLSIFFFCSNVLLDKLPLRCWVTELFEHLLITFNENKLTISKLKTLTCLDTLINGPSNQRLWPDPAQILRHQYEISVAESLACSRLRDSRARWIEKNKET